MNQPFDPINEEIIRGNFGETPEHEATINLSPEDVLDGHAAEVQSPPRRSLVLPAVAASLALLTAIGGGAYYVMSTANPEPEGFAVASADQILPVAPAAGALQAAPTVVAGGDASAAQQLPPANPFEQAPAPVVASAPLTDGATSDASAPQAATEPSSQSALPSDLAALASGAVPTPEPQPAATVVAKPVATPAPAVATATRKPAPEVEAIPAPQAKPVPKTAAKPESTPEPKKAGQKGSAVEVVAERSAPVAKERPRKIITKPVEQAPLMVHQGEAVKPLIVMTAQQIGLKSLTREGLVVASAAGAEAKMYRAGSLLPSGERVEMLDAAAMVIVTDRNVIRITP